MSKPEYGSWRAMIKRCEDPKHDSYQWYGARGISVCERWRRSYSAFISDMGPKPTPDHSVDRYPDADGNYEPGNCRWATREEQAQNKKKARPG